MYHHRFISKIKTMKTFLLLICVAVSASSFAGWHVVKGNGISKTETREAGNYSSLASGGPLHVVIAYGNSNTITLEGEENLLPYIETEVKDKRLTIKIKQGYTLKISRAIQVYVSMTTIAALAQSGSGSIAGEGNFRNDDNTSVAVSGSGSVGLKFASFASLSIRMSGSGNINLSGKIENEADIKQSGSGNADLNRISCSSATVQLSGSGNLRIHADKALTAQISGSGNIYYSGDATVASKISGSGRVRKV